MSYPIGRGALVVLEGCDKAGKTTQAKLLYENMIKFGIPTNYMCFPDRSTKIGQLIDGYLKCNNDLEDHAIHLLFSANRWENVPKMKELLKNGTTLIIDRYAYSGVAFSSAKKDLSLDWCKQCDIGLPKPDLVLFFDLNLNNAEQRTAYGQERYENRSFQDKVRLNFSLMRDDTFTVKHFPCIISL
ncbi:UNVERIFIED_CONTAM: hypothetical protein GTU68_064104 [Idotea baltica]|nr:hypothetical protein [Idotea baltica]